MIRIGVQMAVIVGSLLATVLLILNGNSLIGISVVTPGPQALNAPDALISNAIPPIAFPELGALRETTARPIFFDSRRFPHLETAPSTLPPAAPPPPPEPTVAADQFRFFGTVMQSHQRRALLQGPSVLLDWYAEGAKLGDWTLSRIESNSIFLSSDIKNAELQLFRSAAEK